jgi:hypothetical protein
MRFLVIVLLGLNLAYFIWSSLYPQESVAIQLPPLSEGVSSLTLLSERQLQLDEPISTVASEDPGNKGGDGSIEGISQLSCFTLGPLTNEKSRDVLIGRLKDMGFATESRSLEQRETIGYWVFLPPLENRSVALSMAEELAQKGIKDYYVVTDEEYRHAVSLGLFSEKERANRRMAHIRTLGYKPQKIVRYRDRTYYWLDYEQNADGPLPDSVWKDLGSSKEKIQKLDRTCN